MQQTISENVLSFSLNLLDTLDVSCLVLVLSTSKVKILINRKNSQVTKAFNSWLGTSETLRLLNLNKKLYYSLSHSFKSSFSPGLFISHTQNKLGAGKTKNKNLNPNFNQWLAGLIDGDGCFLLSKKGYASLEITMDIRDEHALQIIKNIYGGSIKLRSGAKALRYRLHHKSGLLTLIKDVNGEIRNSHRLLQLSKICDKYDLSLKYPEKLTKFNGWISGFFDSDGTVTINSTNWQLSISISQKTSEMLQPLIELWGGSVYIDRGKNQSFKWYISKKEDILNLIEYFKLNPSRSSKKNRLHLIPDFYRLQSLKANNALTGSLLEKSWNSFFNKWLSYN